MSCLFQYRKPELIWVLFSCSSESPQSGISAIDPATISSGTWAKQAIFTSKSSALGISAKARIVRLLLVKVENNGTSLTVSEEVCDMIPINSGLTAIRIPAAFIQAVPERSFNFNNAVGSLLASPMLAEVLGADLADEFNDSLPKDKADPRVLDMDNDGYPGVSVGIRAKALFMTISGNVYVVQRIISQEFITSGNSVRLSGEINWSIDQNTLGSDTAILNTVAVAITPINAESSFTMQKIEDTATCNTIIERQMDYFTMPTL